ncbi:MAG: hypothetical protein US89_C0015G0017 [Candidatus Peregrinibacteria bacterium GW2011_GWF2_38_29]|nr:MAG: hypothetical protein US89_C0015G0017 [Candidatus Peregrinibacteria bacterium GW2011_GWF2_38_29]HBB02722.1 hypothetical protein [Candidatus Peregrinibacteria bacterium]
MATQKSVPSAPSENPELSGDLKLDQAKKPSTPETERAKIEANSGARLEALRQAVMTPEDKKKISEVLLPGGEELDAQKIATLSSQELISGESKLTGTLNTLFGSRIAKSKDGKEEVIALHLGEEYKVGDKVGVNFKGNESAYWNIGAGDMMLENVRTVRITDDKGQERVSTLRQGLKGGFFDANGYIPVFDNYTIEVLEVWDKDKMAEYKKDQAKHREEETAQLGEIYKKNPAASRGKVKSIESVLEKPGMENLDKLLDEALNKFGMSNEYKSVLYSFIQYESTFDMHADASKNCPTSSAYGLFQMLRSNWDWTYAELKQDPKFSNYSMDEFRNSLDSQVYAGVLYFKKKDVRPVEGVLHRSVDPNNQHDILLLYVAHHEGGGPGGLGHYIKTGQFKSGQIGDEYAWRVVNGAEAYRQQIARRNGIELPQTAKSEGARVAEGHVAEVPTEGAKESAGEIPMSQTAFVGDSITEGMELSGALGAAGKFGIGGQNTDQMLKRFKGNVIGSDPANPKFKKVVFMGGVNDTFNFKEPDYVIRNIQKMLQIAKASGVKVDLCTIAPWGKFIDNFNYSGNEFYSGLINSGKYTENQIKAILKARTVELNGKIRALSANPEYASFVKVVDTNASMADKDNPDYLQAKYAKGGDGLHPTGSGPRDMVSVIRQEGGIA